MKLYDAHCHLLSGGDEAFAITNGTSPKDWNRASKMPLPAIGLHPWKIQDAASNWQDLFLDLLLSGVAVGEIGLDGLCDVDMDLQIEVFRWQLEEAAKRNLPVSIHCLKAQNPLFSVLKECKLPIRGFNLHAYAGSAEQVPSFAALGAYFSFHAGQLDGNAKKASKAIQSVPANRLLIETDAPDSLKNREAYHDFLRRGYERAAELRGESLESCTEQVANNFKAYFLDD